MKKLLHSLLICMGILMISSQTFAQNADGEKLRPFVGNTYTYTFSGITDGLDYEFYISTSNEGAGSADVGFTGYITSSTTGKVASGTAEATIAWPANAAVDTEVYLFVKISGDGTTVCENYNAVGITPIANAFDLAIVDKTPGTTAEKSCPTITGLQAVVAPTPTYTYNAGTTTLTYEFTKTGNTNKWNLDFDIVQTGTGDYSYTFNGKTSYITDNNVTTNVAESGLTTNTQTLTIKVNNMPGETPVFVISTNSVTDAVTGVSPGTLPSDVTHTINKMPVIGAFN